MQSIESTLIRKTVKYIGLQTTHPIDHHNQQLKFAVRSIIPLSISYELAHESAPPAEIHWRGWAPDVGRI